MNYNNGVTSVILRVKLLDSASTTGAGKTALDHTAAGLIISTIADNEASATVYTSAGSTIEAVTTLGTFAAPTATKCRFKKVDDTNHPGLYEIQIADARWAVSNAKSIIVTVLATGVVPVDAEVQLSVVPADARQWLGGTIPAVNVTGVPLVDAKYLLGTIFSTPATAGILDVNVKNMNNVAATPITTIKAVQGLAVDGVITTLTNLPAITAGWLTNTGIAANAISDSKVDPDVTIASVTGAVGSVTGAVGSVTGNVGGNVTGSVGSVVGAVGSVTGNVGGNVTGSVGSVAGNVGGNVTGSIGSLAIQAKADVNAEADQALADYDAPTNAEMIARTLAAASYATAAAQITAQNDLDILTGSDGVILATSQPNYAPSTAAALASLVTTVGVAGAGLTAADDAVLAALSTLTGLVNQLITACVTAAGEPAQGAPPVSASLTDKVAYLYKFLRNKADQSSTEQKVYADNGSTVDHKRTVSESLGTVTIGEVASGP